MSLRLVIAWIGAGSWVYIAWHATSIVWPQSPMTAVCVALSMFYLIHDQAKHAFRMWRER